MKSVWLRAGAVVVVVLAAAAALAAVLVAVLPTPQSSSANVAPAAPAAFDTMGGFEATSYVAGLDRSSSCTQIMSWVERNSGRVVDVDRGVSLDREEGYAACTAGVSLKVRTPKHTAVIHSHNPSEKVFNTVAAVNDRNGVAAVNDRNGVKQDVPVAPSTGDPRTVMTISANS